MEQTQGRVETDLVEACKRGERDAFRALFDAYQRRVYSTALHFFSGNRTAAEDATQEVFVRALTRIDAFRSECDIATWLYRLTANCCLDEVRKNMEANYKRELDESGKKRESSMGSYYGSSGSMSR